MTEPDVLEERARCAREPHPTRRFNTLDAFATEPHALENSTQHDPYRRCSLAFFRQPRPIDIATEAYTLTIEHDVHTS